MTWNENTLCSRFNFCIFSAPEPQVINFKTVQQRVFPWLATAYAYYFAGMHVRNMYFVVNGEIQEGNVDMLPEVSGWIQRVCVTIRACFHWDATSSLMLVGDWMWSSRLKNWIQVTVYPRLKYDESYVTVCSKALLLIRSCLQRVNVIILRRIHLI